MEQNMLNENLSNMDWRNKLEEVDSLPDLIFTDKNVAWEKLHNRLHQQPRRIKAVWYWTAAACLLTAVIVPLITANKKQPPIVNNNPVSTIRKNITLLEPLPIKENLSTAFSSHKKIAVTRVNQRGADKKIIVTNTVVKSVSDYTTSIEQENKPVTASILIQPLQIPIDKIKTEVAVVEKKKLKVVHVNELGDAALEQHNKALPEDYGVIQFKLIDQQVYTKSSIPAYSIGFNISKPKNVSSN